MAGLQGSAKPLPPASSANWLKNGGHRPLLVSVDVYRPAAREQLKVVAAAIKANLYEGGIGEAGGRSEHPRPSSASPKKRAAKRSTQAATCSSSIPPAVSTSTTNSWTKCNRSASAQSAGNFICC